MPLSADNIRTLITRDFPGVHLETPVRFLGRQLQKLETTRVLCVNGNLEGHSIIPKVKGSQLGQFFSLSACALSFHYSSRAQAAKEGLVLVLLSAAAFKKVFLWNFCHALKRSNWYQKHVNACACQDVPFLVYLTDVLWSEAWFHLSLPWLAVSSHS